MNIIRISTNSIMDIFSYYMLIREHIWQATWITLTQ